MIYTFQNPTGFIDLQISKQILRDRLDLANNLGEIACAIGDSITADYDYDDVLFGRYINIVQSADMGVGGNTSKEVVARLSTILATNAKVYLVAIGINDIRHNDPVEGAITVEEYLSVMTTIIDTLNQNADIFIIGIWPTFLPDIGSAFSWEVTNQMINEWNTGLRDLCTTKNNTWFINPTPAIRKVINTPELVAQYVTDGIHPSNNDCRNIYTDKIIKDTLI